MGQYDFERYDSLLQGMDKYACRVALGDSNALKPLYSLLWELYKNFSPIVLEHEHKKYLDKFQHLRQLIDSNVTANNQLAALGKSSPGISQNIIDLMDELQMEILKIKQFIGLGITVEKKESHKTKLARALGVKMYEPKE